MHYRRLTVAACLFGLAVVASAADFEGQRFALIEPFPGSEVVEFAEDERETPRRIILGALKKVNNVLEPERSKYIRGSRVAITSRIPDERRTSVVKQHFHNQASSHGQILYECRGRQCGSSNYWANTVFDRAILYGPEEDQHYILATMEGESSYYVAIYVAQRGTREIYSHLEIITAPGGRVIDRATIDSALKSQGKFILPRDVDDKALAAIVDAIQARPTWRIAIIGHDSLSRGETVDAAIERTREMAAALDDRLEEAGLEASRVDSFGVGPLAPMDNEERERLELVVLHK
ncbi:MAG: DUF4892 domain-containing protein [Pseudomonadales bacterium]|nr:DUF4892 domain-containing protein [Pseudomonadales bacterium]